jgi:anti-sigma28 factor (negative regulator of flagellin synthesis)
MSQTSKFTRAAEPHLQRVMRIKKSTATELADPTEPVLPPPPQLFAAGTERADTIRAALANGELEIDLELLATRLLRAGGG